MRIFLIVAACILLILPIAEACQDRKKDTTLFAIVGTIRNKTTKEGVPGVVIHVQTGHDGGFRHNSIQTTTDKNGKFRIICPQGMVRLVHPRVAPDGMMIPRQGDFVEAIALTKDQPVVTRHFVAQNVPFIRVHVIENDAGKPVEGVHVMNNIPGPDGRIISETISDKQGMASIAIPAEVTNCRVFYEPRGKNLLSSAPVTLDVEPGFDTATARLEPSQDGVKLTDGSGKKIVVEGCRVRKINDLVTFELIVEAPAKNRLVAYEGRVVNKEGNPIAAANVMARMGGKRWNATTDKFGNFRLNELIAAESDNKLIAAESDNKLIAPSILVTKDGFVAVFKDFRTLEKERGGKTIKIRQINLHKSYSARFKLHDQFNQPIVGAWVKGSQVAGGFTMNAFVKSNRDGMCELKNLPKGENRISIQFARRVNKTILVEKEPKLHTFQLDTTPKNP